MIFDAEGYQRSIMVNGQTDNTRRVERGFAPFITVAAHRACELSTATTPAITELGIGGGGSHLQWKEYFNGSVYGVDLFCKEHREKYQTNPNYGYFCKYFEWLALDTDNANTEMIKAGIVPFWGYDAYIESTAVMVEKAHNAPIDFVLDDASPDKGALNGLIQAWSAHISPTGCIVSETPFGNGTPHVFDMSTSECQSHCETLAEQGMILFYMEEYAKSCTPSSEYLMNYLGFYAHDYSLYADILKKYEHNIVAGKHNWKVI